MIKQHNCIVCRRSFMGGPSAKRCPECRAERARETNRQYKQRKRAGLAREIGSLDECERCGLGYVVEGGLQRFCLDCRPLHYAEYDRRTSIEFYNDNKVVINPSRNERRQVGPKNCDWCGKEFKVKSRALTCSDECRRLMKNRKWNERAKRIRMENKKSDLPTD